MILLNKLVPSSANVRRTGTSVGIDGLAASIKALGLLQNLTVRPIVKGKYEVVAGGRRLAALGLLAKQKEIPAKHAIACNIIDGDATEISLAENVVRIPMHPADQYEAFKSLADVGKGQQEIAARFGTSPQIVRQRLKLASVSPRLIEAYRNDEMTLDQLMAFTVSDDPKAQEAAWFDQPPYNRSPTSIRRFLTSAQVEADDPRVLFVTLDAYKAAGGGLIRDLFDEDHGGYLTDATLFDRLVAAKLANEAEAVRGEGWKWVEFMPNLDYETRSRFRNLHPEQVPLLDDQQQELDGLVAEYDGLVEQHSDEPPPEVAEKLDTLSQRVDRLSEGEFRYCPEDIACGGAIVTIVESGEVNIVRGLLRPEDRPLGATPEERPQAKRKSGSDGGLSARLVEELTAHRTAALRIELAARPDVALAATVHALALPLLYGHAFDVASCLAIRIISRDLEGSAERFPETEAGQKLAAASEGGLSKLPPEPKDLLWWLLAQDTDTLLRFLAYCTAASIDAVRGKQDRLDCPRLGNADCLAGVLGLDMATYWQPTKASYFSRVPKALVLAAVREGVSPQAADNLTDLKRDALAEAAEKHMASSRWLPPVLRRAEAAVPELEPQAA
jgi:ParB family chromosome partitioning protein